MKGCFEDSFQACCKNNFIWWIAEEVQTNEWRGWMNLRVWCDAVMTQNYFVTRENGVWAAEDAATLEGFSAGPERWRIFLQMSFSSKLCSIWCKHNVRWKHPSQIKDVSFIVFDKIYFVMCKNAAGYHLGPSTADGALLHSYCTLGSFSFDGAQVIHNRSKARKA